MSACIAVATFFFCHAALFAAARGRAEPVVIAYVFPQNSVLRPGQIDARKVTRINYAFANIKDGRIVQGFQTDPANYAALNALKKQNPSLTVLVSVGGWLGSGNFSDAVLTRQSRARFIDSAVAFIEKYNLDGLDLDWEYPGQAGAGNRFRPEDKQNYTTVLRELRSRFNVEEKKLHRKLYLSIAAGSNWRFLENTQMAQVQKYVDTVDLMAYDYYQPDGSSTTGMNAPLFTDPADPKHVSADQSVKMYEQAGVPASKIVLGVPFYGHEWADVPNKNHGLYQPGRSVPNAQTGFASIADKTRQGFVRYWDAASEVPYLYNASTHFFVSYDDTQSMGLKCRYVLNHHLAGIMFWNYSSDPTGALLDTIDDALLHERNH